MVDLGSAGHRNDGRSSTRRKLLGAKRFSANMAYSMRSSFEDTRERSLSGATRELYSHVSDRHSFDIRPRAGGNGVLVDHDDRPKNITTFFVVDSWHIGGKNVFYNFRTLCYKKKN